MQVQFIKNNADPVDSMGTPDDVKALSMTIAQLIETYKPGAQAMAVRIIMANGSTTLITK